MTFKIAVGLNIAILLMFIYCAWDDYRTTYSGEAMLDTVVGFIAFIILTVLIWGTAWLIRRLT